MSTGNAHQPLTGVYEQWDAVLLRSIAQHGYWGGPGGTIAHPNQAAFFPGYPLALAAVHLAVRNWVLAELLLSLAAGCVAVVSLTRLAGTPRAAAFLLVSPAAVFLTVGYSECLFLACAVPAWAAGQRGAWRSAGVFGFFAALTRPDGLFLLAALVVMAVTGPRGVSRWRALAALAPAVLAPGMYAVFLWERTGRWSAWMDANRAGWGLRYVGPWQALKASYAAAFGHAYEAQAAFMEQLEIAGVVVMLTAAVVYAARGRWPEAVYCGLAVAALGTATLYQSVPRTVLVLFPLWVSLAGAAGRRPWLGGVYVAVCGPLGVVVAVSYLGGAWAG